MTIINAYSRSAVIYNMIPKMIKKGVPKSTQDLIK